MILVIILLLIISLLFLLKSNNNDSNNTKEKDIKSMDYLLDKFLKMQTEPNINYKEEIFPPFYVEYTKNILTKESLQKNYDKNIEKYGDNFKITFRVDEEKELTDEELKSLNDFMHENYGTDDKAEECYRYEGKFFFSGSKKTGESTISETKTHRCKYNGEWYIVQTRLGA